jgi:transcriptional regulator with XRE-family HTH domain
VGEVGSDDVAGVREPDWALPPLHQRLERLFETRINEATGRRWTLRQVTEAVNDLGVTLSTTFLMQLKNGDRSNPTMHQLEGIARVFGVHPNYFLGDEETVERIDQKLHLLAAIQEHPEVEQWLAAAAKLSKRDVRLITSMIQTATSDADDPADHKSGVDDRCRPSSR